MRLYSLQAVQRIHASIGEAWSFLSDPRNLSTITPSWLGFEVTSDLPSEMYPGMIIRYRVRPVARVPITWVTEITHVREPHLFVDEQRFGPYRFWHHQHHLQEVEGGVEMRDIVHYAPPRPAASLVDRWMVGPRLREIFAHRRRILEDRFGAIP